MQLCRQQGSRREIGFGSQPCGLEDHDWSSDNAVPGTALRGTAPEELPRKFWLGFAKRNTVLAPTTVRRRPAPGLSTVEIETVDGFDDVKVSKATKGQHDMRHRHGISSDDPPV